MKPICVRNIYHIAAVSLAAWSVSLAAAQSEIRYQVIPAGGGLSSGGRFSLIGSAGQVDAGVSSGGAFSVSGGFLPIIGGDPPRLYGDLNCDGRVDNFDVDGFVVAISDAAAYMLMYPGCDIMNADANGDGHVDNFDVDAFVECLSNGGCQ